MRNLSLSRFVLPLIISALSATYSEAAVKVYDEINGVVVVEAENFSDRKAADDGHHWHIVPQEDGTDAPFNDTHTTDYLNGRGSYVTSLPDGGQNRNAANLVGNGNILDYKVNINTPGTYQLYLRWGGFDGGSDSIYAQIVEVSSPPFYRYGDGSNPDDADFETVTQPTAATGWDGIAAPDNVGGGGGEVPAVYTLAGGVYTIRVSQREDGSALDALILQRSNLPPPASPGPAESPQATQFIAVTEAPQSTTAAPGTTARFTVAAEGTGTITYQWQSKAPGAADFSNIPGATTTSFTTAATTDAMNGTQYRVVISNGTKTVNSAAATLTTDATPPTLVRTSGGAGQTSVALVFSERLDKTSAETFANYTIAGLNVTGAKLSSSGTTVVLTTARQTAGTSYTLTANAVKDAAGNAMTVAGSGSFTGATLVPGKVLVRLYRGIGGTAVNNLVTNPKYPNSPDEVFLWDVFSSGDSTGDVFGENYGGEITGLYTPPTTGNYKFYIRSDDASQLFLSTDDTEGGLRLIAAQGGCCNAFTDAPGSLSSQPIALEAGKPYFVRAFWKEGGGGDWIQVGVLGPNDPDINDASSVVPIPGSFLSTGFSKTATISISQQPTNITVGANSPATFTVGFNANSVLGTGARVQWQRAPAGSSAFTAIPDGTNSTFTLQFPSAADNGAQFRALLTVEITDPDLGTSTTATSQAATLTVTSDTTAPTVAFVIGGVSQIVVGFSEPMDAATATAAGNYQVSGGVTVNSGQVISGAGQAGQVRLALTGVVPGQSYTITISGVKDAAGNAVASTTKSFDAFHVISTFDDDRAVPPGAALAGSANIKGSGSYNGSGFLELTPNANGQQGSIVYGDVLPGADVQRFTATFKLFIGRGSGNPADGASFSIASDVAADPAAPTSFGEEGAGTGLTIAFDTYDNGGAEAPAFSLKWQGTEFATTNVTKATLVNNQWVDVVIQVDATGRLTLYHNNVKYYDNEQIPGWAPIAAAQVGLGGRTGGENEVNWIDDFKLVVNADVAVPKPPTISITSPANNATFAVGASAIIQVNAQDPEGQIAKVEFFANGSKIGESTTAPYSFTIPNLAQGVYLVTAKVTDGQGLAVTSAQIKAIVGNPDKILFVHGNAGPNATDTEVISHLIAIGYDVITVGAAASATADADGKVLVVISSSVPSGDVTEKFLDVPMGVLNWENALEDNLLFTTNDGTDRGTTGSQTQVEITDPSHPIAGGLTGIQTITTGPAEFSWGVPAPAAKRVATLTDGTGHVGIYAYDKGGLLIDGTSLAAGKRVHFLNTDATYAVLNAVGKQLFDNAINWAAGKSISPPTNEVVRANITSSGGQVTISSTAGGTVQATDNLVPGNWLDIGPAPQTVQTTGSARFFRIKK